MGPGPWALGPAHGPGPKMGAWTQGPALGPRPPRPFLGPGPWAGPRAHGPGPMGPKNKRLISGWSLVIGHIIYN